VSSCTKTNKLDVDVSKIDAKVSIKRFEQVFYGSKPEELPKIKAEFPYLFPHNIDSVWVNKMQDKDEQELFAEIQRIYPNLDTETKELASLFKHVKYYYPKFKDPEIITLNSNISLQQRVIFNSDKLFISLETFLGKDSPVYETYPDYVKDILTKEQLPIEVAKAIAKPTIFLNSDRSFVSNMIQQGKLMYLLDAFFPNKTDVEKIGFSKIKHDWLVLNQSMIWKYFIERDILHSTNPKLNQQFIEFGPFSKFYLDIDNDSPSQVGIWFGWQIVRSFMDNNEVSLTEMLRLKNETIFKKSKYKPEK
jgi:gliding motility-associated lipoprotein GldB